MPQEFYRTWVIVAVLVIAVGWWLTARVPSLDRRRLLRLWLIATAMTPFPAWVPREGLYIIPAAFLFFERGDTMVEWFEWALHGFVPIALVCWLLQMADRVVRLVRR